jgi:hypothetical protein
MTFDDLLHLLHVQDTVTVKFFLNYGLYSCHELRLVRRTLVDFSHVDGSTTRCSVAKYRNGFYGQAFKQNAVKLLED